MKATFRKKFKIFRQKLWPVGWTNANKKNKKKKNNNNNNNGSKIGVLIRGVSHQISGFQH